MMHMHSAIGYFDGPGDTPTRDPGLSVLCVVCACPLCVGTDDRHGLPEPRKTISLMPEGGSRSYFFRVHARCWDALSADEQSAYESSVIDHA